MNTKEQYKLAYRIARRMIRFNGKLPQYSIAIYYAIDCDRAGVYPYIAIDAFSSALARIRGTL